MVERKVWKMYI